MRFWVREIVGWLLMVVSLYLFLLAIGVALGGDGEPARPVSAGVVTGIGFILFRGGIHLVKVAAAGAAVLAARRELASGSARTER